MKISMIASVFILCWLSSDAQRYKYMMEDRSYTIYEVVEEAEKYFATIDRNKKGSGWKGYNRWLNKVEPMYYPSGDRMGIDPRFTQKGHEKFLKDYPPTTVRDDEGWQDLGPYNASNISGHYSPGIGRVEHVWVDPSDADKIYMGSRSGGFWRSLDAGLTWENTTDNLPSSGVDVFDVNPNNSNDILINLRNAGNGVTMGIYRSLDGGSTWNETVFNPTDTGVGGLGTSERVYDVRFSPHNSDDIYICASGNLYRSNDNLATVNIVSDKTYFEVEFHATNPNILFAPREYYWNRNEVYHSTDGGATWNLLHDFTDNDYRSITVGTTPANSNLVFFSSSTKIWKSEDNGQTVNPIAGSEDRGPYFEVSDIDADVMINGGIDIRMSYDGGANWQTVTDWYWPGGGSPPSDYVHADLRFSTFRNGVIYSGTDGYVVKSSDNGVTWEILSNGTGIRENYRLGVSQSNDNITVCGSQDNGTSIYQGQTSDWLEWIGADGMEGLVHPLDEDRMLGSIQLGNKRRSLDGGYNTSAINNHPELGDANWIAPVFFDPLDHMALFTVGQTTHQSEDFGTTWNALHEFDDASLNHLVKSENNEAIILAAKNEKLYRSTDNGVSFVRVGSSVLPNNAIQDITFDPTNDLNVIVVYAHHEDDGSRIYRSINGGVTWQNITYNLSALPARSVAIDHTDSKTIYIGTETGVFKKTWTGTQYEAWNTNIPTVSIYELEIVYGTNTLRAATWGRGLWERCLDGRATFPKITNVDIDAQISETSPQNGENIALTATIEDPDDISSIFMRYSINDISLDQEIGFSRFNTEQYILDSKMPFGAINDKLYFKIYAVNMAGDTTETYRYMYTLRNPADHCEASGSTGTGSDYINYVNINGTVNNSGQDYYGDFTNVPIEIDQFKTYSMEVGLAAAFPADSVFAWIDWDQNSIFEENERITFSQLDNQNIASATFTVYDEAKANQSVIMRIRNQWGEDTPSPCGSDIAGEVEDYRIVIKAACASNKTVTNLNNKRAGSLRFLINKTCPGDSLYISNDLNEETLVVYESQIDINRDITIIGLPNYGFALSGDEARRIFKVNTGVTLGLQDLKLMDCIDDPNGGAIYNQGHLILSKVLFENNLDNITPQAVTNDGLITILPGVTEIKE